MNQSKSHLSSEQANAIRTAFQKQPSKAAKALPPKQEAFVREYLIDLNASAAYRRAGYTSGNADVNGPRLLGNAGIQTSIQTLRKGLLDDAEITAARVILELKRLALFDPLDLFNPDGSMKALKDIPEDARRAIGGIEIRELKDMETQETVIATTVKKIKLSDKKGALDSLARYFGLFNDRVEVTGSIQVITGVPNG